MFRLGEKHRLRAFGFDQQGRYAAQGAWEELVIGVACVVGNYWELGWHTRRQSKVRYMPPYGMFLLSLLRW